MKLKPLIIREIKAFLKNPAFIISIILLISMYGAIGRIAGSGVSAAVSEEIRTPVGLVLEDRSNLTLLLVEFLNESMGGRLYVFNTLEEAVESVNVVVIIPSGFTENATSPGRPVKLYGWARIDTFSPIRGQVRTGVLSSIAEIVRNLLPVVISRLYNVTVSPNREVLIESKLLVYNKLMSSAEYSILSSSLLFLTIIVSVVIGISAGYSAQATAVEKVEKAFEMLLAQPIPRSYIVIAKIIGALAASVMFALAYLAGIMFMMTGMMPRTPPEPTGVSGLAEYLLSDPLMIVFMVTSLIIGVLFSGSLGVVIGALVSDERIAAALASPVIFIFMGLGFASIFIGFKLSPVTAIVAGLGIAPLALYSAVSIMAGNYTVLAIAYASAVIACIAVMGVARTLFNRDIVVLGLRISWKRIMREKT
ncbi:MAG: ABC transporter permease [Thermoprotei archaeon]